MRALAIFLVGILLVGPAGALVVPHPGPSAVALAAQQVVPLPDDIKDAEVLALLAASMGWRVERLPIPTPAPGLTVSDMVLRLGARAGVPVAPGDAAAFAALDAQLAAPLLVLLVAVEEAWVLRDEAFADVTQEMIDEARRAMAAGDVESMALALEPANIELLVTAAIMLSDTIESVVIPGLQAASDAGVWPASEIADPVGVLRVGGTGDDVETVDRIVQVDARGNDAYYNNAGGTTVLSDFDQTTIDTPIAAHIDLAGDDKYYSDSNGPAQGSAEIGIGIAYDIGGNDTYWCNKHCAGGASAGVGIHRDTAGDDAYRGVEFSFGFGNYGIGFLRNDVGNETYTTSTQSGGYGYPRAVALLWDRSGTDLYRGSGGGMELYGFGRDGGRGWFVDEGSEIDAWQNIPNGDPHPKMCNDCIWSAGRPSPTGKGNDNQGGLAYLLAYQENFPPVG